jgi:hypothetical protein
MREGSKHSEDPHSLALPPPACVLRSEARIWCVDHGGSVWGRSLSYSPPTPAAPHTPPLKPLLTTQQMLLYSDPPWADLGQRRQVAELCLESSILAAVSLLLLLQKVHSMLVPRSFWALRRDTICVLVAIIRASPSWKSDKPWDQR